MTRRSAAPLFAFLVLCGTPGAEAAGFWNLDRGPSNFGRGGANYADPDDPIAIFTNPAALAGLRGLQINIDANAAHDQRRFERAPDSFGRRDYRYEAVTNASESFVPSPGVFATYNFGALDLEALTVGFGIYGPPASPVVWSQQEGECRLPRPETCTGAQRYSQIDRHNAQIHYALAAAYELPWFNLRLGVNVMLIDQIVSTGFKLNAPLFEDPNRPENPEFDIHVAAHAKASAVPCAIFAASGRPFDWLVLAVSFQLPYSIHATGTAEIELSGFYQQLAAVEGNAIGIDLDMPSLFRAAVQYDDPSGLFDIELVVVWEQWSRNQEIVFTPEEISLALVGSDGEPIETTRQEIQTVVLDNRWRDNWSVRLGGEAVLLPDLLLIRLGAFWEESPVPFRRTTVGVLDLDKLGFTLGARIDLPFTTWADLPFGAWIDLAGGYVWWKPRTVSNSEVSLVNPLYPDLVKHPIGNGTYSNEQFYLQAGIGARIDI